MKLSLGIWDYRVELFFMIIHHHVLVMQLTKRFFKLIMLSKISANWNFNVFFKGFFRFAFEFASLAFSSLCFFLLIFSTLTNIWTRLARHRISNWICKLLFLLMPNFVHLDIVIEFLLSFDYATRDDVVNSANSRSTIILIGKKEVKTSASRRRSVCSRSIWVT